MIVQTNAIQFLPVVFMNQFYTLSTQWIGIENMHEGVFILRRSAANDKIFKKIFLHPFLASTIYNNTIKNKFDIG